MCVWGGGGPVGMGGGGGGGGSPVRMGEFLFVLLRRAIDYFFWTRFL